jgi:phage replication O-like protein O
MPVNPQLEDGYVRLARELLAALARTRIPGEPRQALDAIMLKTYGWQKTEDAISLSQLQALTKLERKYLCRALRFLEEHNFIIRKKGPITRYAVNKIYEGKKGWIVSKKGRPNIGTSQIRESQSSESDSPIIENQAVPIEGHTKETSTKDNNTKEMSVPVGTKHELFEKYETVSGRHVKAREKYIPKIKAALKIFSTEEIEMAWREMAANDFLRGRDDDNKRGKDYFTIEYALRTNKIDEYLNEAQKQVALAAPQPRRSVLDEEDIRILPNGERVSNR